MSDNQVGPIKFDSNFNWRVRTIPPLTSHEVTWEEASIRVENPYVDREVKLEDRADELCISLVYRKEPKSPTDESDDWYGSSLNQLMTEEMFTTSEVKTILKWEGCKE